MRVERRVLRARDDRAARRELGEVLALARLPSASERSAAPKLRNRVDERQPVHRSLHGVEPASGRHVRVALRVARGACGAASCRAALRARGPCACFYPCELPELAAPQHPRGAPPHRLCRRRRLHNRLRAARACPARTSARVSCNRHGAHTRAVRQRDRIRESVSAAQLLDHQPRGPNRARGLGALRLHRSGHARHDTVQSAHPPALDVLAYCVCAVPAERARDLRRRLLRVPAVDSSLRLRRESRLV
eukprot:Amastigsp_a510086_10.p3 type:complete len:248 gc:universal Amastigsp_a510086_10:594-1337(+)